MSQQTVFVGNSPLFVENGGPDGLAPLVILGEYNPSGPSSTTVQPLPTGLVQDVKFYGQFYDFTLYALTLVASGPNANEQTFQVVASQHFSGFSESPDTITLAVSNFRVNAGDFLAFAGIGPWYPQQPNDAPDTDATYEDSSNPTSFIATPPVLGEPFSVGIYTDPSATYEYISDFFGNQGRTYGIGVDVLETNQDFAGANLKDADLQGLNLQKLNFSNANLLRANLTGAFLFGADLSDANLHGANLSGANLSGANLSGANLSGADLENANFAGANLSGANLNGANTAGAVFTGATTTGCNDCP